MRTRSLNFLSGAAAGVFFVFLFFLSAYSAEAKTLADFEQDVMGYQTAPMERANALEKELAHYRGSEDGLARQNGVAVSRILKYELTLDNLINMYRSVAFLQKRGSQEESFMLSDERMSEIVDEVPPYSFLFYLNFIEDVQNVKRELAVQQERQDNAKDYIASSAKERLEREREYRLRSAKIETGGDSNMLTAAWELVETKSKLEQSIVTRTFYAVSLELATNSLEQISDKKRILESLLPKVSKNVKVMREDFQYLDASVFARLKALNSDINFLSKRHAALNAMIQEDPLPAPFRKYSRQVELALVEREILVLLDIVEFWSSMRLTWTTASDLLEGSLSVPEEKEMVDTATMLINQTDATMAYCGKEIQKIRECQQEVQRRFANEFMDNSEQAEAEHKAFLLTLEAQKGRYLQYIVDMGGMKSQHVQLLSEINRILDKQSPEKQLGYFWYDNLDDVLNFELWHFGDYPVTLYGVLKALLILVVGLILTRSVAVFFKNRMMKRLSMSEHSILLIEKLLYYTGFIISALLSLWSLRIPLTAFAFLGGAMAIALGLGTQKIMGDFFSGLLLIFQKKLRIGDEVIIGDERGIVREITIQNTVLRCDMSRDLIIPNSKVHESAIINLTRDDSRIMVTVLVSISYGSDVDKAAEIIKRILMSERMVLGYPEFLVRIDDLAESAIVFRIMFYVDLANTRDGEAASIVRYKILQAFAEEGIEIPFPQTEVHIKNNK